MRIRPLVRNANLYHILPRPDGKVWDGIEYYDSETGNGAVFIFKPDSDIDTQNIRLKGLEAESQYELAFEDGSNPSVAAAGADLIREGIDVGLTGRYVSEIVFITRW